MRSLALILAFGAALALPACTLDAAQLGSGPDAVDGGATDSAASTCGDAGMLGHGGMGGMGCSMGMGSGTQGAGSGMNGGGMGQ